ncbi:histidine kinase [Kineosporia babensis]
MDLALAAGTTGIEIGLLSDSFGAPEAPHPSITVALSVCAGMLILLHRRCPLSVLTSILLIEAVLAAIGAYPGGAPAVVAIGLVGLREERRRSVPAVVVTAIVLQVSSISAVPVPILAWAAGVYVQTRLRYVSALSERAEQLEREREQRDLIAAQAERTAIARELHDIVAHSVTVMLLGVRGARDSVRSNPDLAEEALRRVEKSGEESMAELRRMLHVLREPDAASTQQATGRPSSTIDLAPAPTASRIPDLVQQHRQAGMPVTLQLTGITREAPPGIELTAYRIVQEGLTNVLKHAQDPSRVRVELNYQGEQLHVMVEDDGRTAASIVSNGHGLRGLRERVSATHGELMVENPATPSPIGFRLTAHLPLPKDETP